MPVCESIYKILYKNYKIKDLKEYLVVDVYSPENSEDLKFVTMRTIFHNDEQTLPGEKIKEYEDSIISHLEKASISLKS